MSFKAVFLDAGGTLIRERASRARIYARTARSRGLAVSDDEMAQRMYRAHQELPRTLDGAFRYTERWFRRFMEHIFIQGLGLEHGQLAGVQAELWARFRDPATFELAPGARELCEWLSASGVRVAVVSNWSEPLPEILAGLGLAHALDAIAVSAVEGVEKPDPALFERARLRLPHPQPAPGDIVHLGDRVDTDVVGARAAGLRAVLYDPEQKAPFDTDCERVDSFDGFRSWLINPRKTTP